VDLDWAAAILEPHFDAVRDTFASFRPSADAKPLDKLRRVKFVISEEMHDTRRHFAATRTDGLLMMYAPQIVDLSLESLVAIVGHEFGHAADMLYPGSWTWPLGSADASLWIGEEPAGKATAWRLAFGRERAKSQSERDNDAPAANWMCAWEDRSGDSVEWAADGICEAVTGKRPKYCGDCLIQSFSCGIGRPSGLR